MLLQKKVLHIRTELYKNFLYFPSNIVHLSNAQPTNSVTTLVFTDWLTVTLRCPQLYIVPGVTLMHKVISQSKEDLPERQLPDV